MGLRHVVMGLLFIFASIRCGQNESDLKPHVEQNDLSPNSYDVIPDACDSDGDGVKSLACGGSDCNDLDQTIFPNAIDSCNGIDDNCDDVIDTRLPLLHTPSYLENIAKLRDLVWTGDEYGQVYWESRQGTWSDLNDELYFSRLNRDGNTIGEPVRITQAQGESRFASAVWNGVEYGVAWNDARDDSYAIYFARLTAQGQKIGEEIKLDSITYHWVQPSLVWTGREFGVVWTDVRSSFGDIYFARISAQGTLVGKSIRISTTSGDNARLAWDGENFGVVWAIFNDTQSGRFARISTGGEKIGQDVILADTTFVLPPQLVWADNQYALLWQQAFRQDVALVLSRLDKNGSRAGPDITVSKAIHGIQNYDIVWTGTEFGIIWPQYFNSSRDVMFFARYSASGQEYGTSFQASQRESDSRTIKGLFWTDTHYSAFWEEHQQAEKNDYYLARLGGCWPDDLNASDVPDIVAPSIHPYP